MENVNVSKSQMVTNAFHLFYASGKAALLPFITLFFRQLGLSATQTGIIIGVRSLLAMMFGPMWVSCAVSCHKKRPVLMISIFSTMVACLLLSVVPPADPNVAKSLCMPVKVEEVGAMNVSTTQQPNFATNSVVEDSKAQQVGHTTMQVINTGGTTKGLVPSPMTHSALSDETSKVDLQISTTKLPKISPDKQVSDQMFSTTPMPKTTLAMESVSRRNASTDSVWGRLPNELKEKLLNYGIKQEDIEGLSTEQVKVFINEMIKELQKEKSVVQPPTTASASIVNVWNNLSYENQKLLESFGIHEENIQGMTKEKVEEFVHEQIEELQRERNRAGARRSTRDIFSTTLNKLSKKITRLQEEVSASQNMVFAFVLCIVIVGEVFSSSTEKLADKIWFDVLDGLDIIEKYGTHRTWCVLGFIFVPLLVTVAVDHTPCVLPHGIYHINIHFYIYAAFMGLAFIFAYIYPILHTTKKSQRRNKLMKGLKILFIDIHGFSYTFSILLLGFLSAGLENFLFWVVQDLGGTELIMGGAVALAAVSELAIFISMKWFLHKITHIGAVILSFMVMAVRLVIYSFLWAPYMILPVAIMHAFSSALLIGAVENYPDFKVNPLLMDRSARSVLQGIYTGVGYASGSIVSGILCDLYGLSAVYQGGAIICVCWCILFALVHKCAKRKTKVRYARLLQAEEDQGTDDSESVDEDWLETALKHEK